MSCLTSRSIIQRQTNKQTNRQRNRERNRGGERERDKRRERELSLISTERTIIFTTVD